MKYFNVTNPLEISQHILEIINDDVDTFENMDAKTSINNLKHLYFPNAGTYEIIEAFSMLRRKHIKRHNNEHYIR